MTKYDVKNYKWNVVTVVDLGYGNKFYVPDDETLKTIIDDCRGNIEAIYLVNATMLTTD